MRYWALSALGAIILSSSSGFASPVQNVLSGIYEGDEQRSRNAFATIDDATTGVSPDKRLITRMRLRKSIAVSRIRISVAGKRLGIAYDAKAPIVVWIGGEPITWKLTDELVFDVSAKANGDAISLTFRGNDSERTTVYRSVGQQLVEETTITSPLLTTPISYELVYSRAN